MTTTCPYHCLSISVFPPPITYNTHTSSSLLPAQTWGGWGRRSPYPFPGGWVCRAGRGQGRGCDIDTVH